MLGIHRSENGEVLFTLSGQLDEEAIAEVGNINQLGSERLPHNIRLKRPNAGE
jgi:hypothetical protein